MNPGQTLAHYLILGRIGTGAMGIVYKAEDTRLGRTVALKSLPERLADDPDAAARFLREARLAAQINHPNVCTIFDVHDDPTGERFIVMEFIDGVTLRTHVAQLALEGARMPIDDVITATREIASALTTARELGIVHRDIKSDNIMLDARGHTRVMDFGLAREVNSQRVTRDTSILGTIAYMAPEVIQGGEPDWRSDLFSFGTVVYEMLTGRLPFRGAYEAAMMYSIVNEAPDRLQQTRDDVPEWLASVVEALLLKDPETRGARFEQLLPHLVITPSMTSYPQPVGATPAATTSALSSPQVTPRTTTASELRIYIAGLSVLDEEREHITRHVVPELRLLARQRGIVLRVPEWSFSALSGGSAAKGLASRLAEIDRCRPYFVGIMAADLGRVPEIHELSDAGELRERYPWVEDAVFDGAGLVEIELRHGLLNHDDGSSRGRRFLYVRSGRTSSTGTRPSDVARERTRALVDDVQERGIDVRSYIGPGSLGEMLIEEVHAIVERDFSDRGEATWLQLERRRHQAFALSRRASYVPVRQLVVALNDHIAEDAGALVVCGPAGSGKSSLVAYWCESIRRRRPDLFVVEHYIGIGVDAELSAVLLHVIEEIRDRFKRPEAIPACPSEIYRSLRSWLAFACGTPTVIVLDGIDQLRTTEIDLKVLTDNLPRGVQLICTTADGGEVDRQFGAGWSRLDIEPMGDSERRALISRFMEDHHDDLDRSVLEKMVAAHAASLPLYLKIVLEEMALERDPRRRASLVDRSLRANDVPSLFQIVLERLEDDMGTRTVREAMSHIWGTKGGILDEELVAVSDVSSASLSTLLARLDYHLVRDDGGLSFFHNYLRSAVEERYLTDGDRRLAVRHTLADHFAGLVDDILPTLAHDPTLAGAATARAAEELLHQLVCADMQERLAERLSSIPFLHAFFRGDTRYPILAAWGHLSAPDDVVKRCMDSLDDWMRNDALSPVPSDLAEPLVELFEIVGAWDASMHALHHMITMARNRGDNRALSQAELKLGWVCYAKGQYDVALAHTERAYALAETLGDATVMANATGNMGIIRRVLGDYHGALECYRKQRDAAETLADRGMLARAVGNIGTSYLHFGELDRALEYIAQQRAIAIELNDRRLLSVAIGNIGIVYLEQGDTDRALEYFLEQLSIDEEVGDRSGMATTLDNIGGIYARRGEHAKAIEFHQRSRLLAESIGYLRGEFTATGNIGVALSEMHDEANALDYLSRAIDGHRSIGYLENLQVWLAAAANVVVSIVEHSEQPPESLRRFGVVQSDAWKGSALNVAEELAREALELSHQMELARETDTCVQTLAHVASLRAATDQKS